MKLKYQKWLNKHGRSLSNSQVLITGANSGIGFQTVLCLVSLGASIIMACRNLKKAEQAKEKIIAIFPNADLQIIEYDQSSLQKIDQAVEKITELYPLLDVVILNAGIFHPKKGEKTIDGYNLTIGTNFLGACYFVEKLQKRIAAKQRLHFVFLASLVYKTRKKITEKTLTADNLGQFQEYAVSKKLLVSYAYYLFKQNRHQISLVHPGVTATNIYSSTNSHFPQWFMALAHQILPIFAASPQKAALSVVQGLLSTPKKEFGIYGPRGMFEISGYPKYRRINKRIINENKEIIEVITNFLKSKKVEEC